VAPIPPPVTRLLIIGEVRLYREGLADALGCNDSIEVVGTAAGGEHGLAQIAQLEPELVLVDMQGGLGLIRSLRRLRPPPRVLALAVQDDEEEVIACAEAGVAGYVTREASLDDLAAAVASVARGELVASPRMTAALLRRVGHLAAEKHPESAVVPLTARERDVMHLVDRGLTNKEIATALHIELPTVKNHVHRVLEKLQVRRRGDAVARLRADRQIPSQY
jgi:DNA-binding NarL/FixJ family response regulator